MEPAGYTMGLNSIGYDEIIPKTLQAMPEMRDAYEKEAAHWTEVKMGPYNLFDIIVMPRVIDQLNGDGHDDELRQAFNFFEELASHPNVEIRNVIGVGVCEELCCHEAALQKAVKFMGTRTKAYCDIQLKD